MISWRDIFYLQKSDRRGLFALLALAAIAVGVLTLCGTRETEDSEASLDTLAQVQPSLPESDETGQEPYYAVPTQAVERFAFDPNTADSAALLRLGLQPWQVRNIYKYRARGGIYRQKEDFARLYGLTVKQYRELEPYIRISDDYRPAAEVIAQKPSPAETSAPQETREQERNVGREASTKLTLGQTVSLSQADTTQLQRIPGIGPYYARRIVEYRERLGGYYDVMQLMEIDGFPEEALDYIQLGTSEIHRINVNRLTLAQLRRHPYISFYQARAITDYRRLYGDLTDISQLSLLKDFTDDDIRRLRPYLEY